MEALRPKKKKKGGGITPTAGPGQARAPRELNRLEVRSGGVHGGADLESVFKSLSYYVTNKNTFLWG